jgi:hypothetical protein
MGLRTNPCRANEYFQYSFALEQITFETLHPAWSAKMNFAYASWAGGDASRDQSQSIFILKLLIGFQQVSKSLYSILF